MSNETKTSVRHESAQMHVTGDATYIDDLPLLQATLFGALVLSTHAHAHIELIDIEPILKHPDVVAVISAKDIKGKNSCGPIMPDDPILAEKLVEYIGQPILLVVAKSYFRARKAAQQIQVHYQPITPILTSQLAHEQKSYVIDPISLQQHNAHHKSVADDIEVHEKFEVGGQEHFYLEGHISVVVPKENQCFDVFCSTQHPTEMQHLVAQALLCDNHQVRVEMRRMGGAFGGKESQSALFCCIAAVAAQRLNRPIKLRLDRDDDMMIMGKRHPFSYSAKLLSDATGKIKSYQLELLLDCGFSADLSAPVAGRALCHTDNAYFLPQANLTAYLCKTNKQSNTAFRGFGGPQGAFAIEYTLDSLARTLNIDALDIRKKNFYQGHQQKTPYDQTVEDNVINELVSQLEVSSDYRQRRESITKFNKQSPIIKKGLALTPVKFGISFNVVHFNQAGALVHIYTDGSILVNHGGTEMGQGLHTKMLQIVAEEFAVDISRVKATATDTSKVANTSATAASTGSDLNGMAIFNAVSKIKYRLKMFLAEKYKLNFNDIQFSKGEVVAANFKQSFKQVVQSAYSYRVQLWSDGFYKTPDVHWNPNTFKGSPFYYFAYGAAVSEVAVDTLTGEAKILRSDLLHDAGQSINSAIDKGQVEGGFIQGVGWLTSEELVWDKQGKLLTHAPSTYKIPAISDCPEVFNTSLFKNKNKKQTIKRSKAVGEPPLLLGFSVFFAIRDAISSVSEHTINPPLNAPATAEEILNSIQYCQQQI